jgi:putative SOS response-associated peptidase YedK
MCYNISYLTKKRLDYAKRLGELADAEELEKVLDYLSKKANPVYYTSGFAHPDVPVITNKNSGGLQLFSWGLIPAWVKDIKQAVEISSKTLNARGEEMFDKPSFRLSARKKRCLVLVDGFFEFHWVDSKSVPFYIQLKNREPITLAGIWETWKYPAEPIRRNTFSIVTTRANPLMKYIHNKPKGSEGPRMPVIIPKGSGETWLNFEPSGNNMDYARIKDMITPFDENQMDAYPVASLKGKEGVGNSPKALEKMDYPELNKKEAGNNFKMN